MTDSKHVANKITEGTEFESWVMNLFHAKP